MHPNSRNRYCNLLQSVQEEHLRHVRKEQGVGH